MYSDPSSVDDIGFLVSSTNRLDVFDAIRTGPKTRHELREQTEASRVTLSRILGDLEDREWISRKNGEYTTTPKGGFVAAEIAQVFANLEAIDGLRGTLQWLPSDDFDFDLACLAEARVLSSTERNLTAAITHTANRIREATYVRNVATGISSEVVDAYLDAATSGAQQLETILYSSVFDTIRNDATLHAQFSEMLDSDGITVRRYEGEEPSVMLTICDDTVVMCGQSNSRSPPEGLETSNEAVRAWARAYFDRIRANAIPITTDVFTA